MDVLQCMPADLDDEGALVALGRTEHVSVNACIFEWEMKAKSHTHTHAHARTYTHARTHTHTHTHTHTETDVTSASTAATMRCRAVSQPMVIEKPHMSLSIDPTFGAASQQKVGR